MNQHFKLLFVDDEPNFLSGMRRQLYDRKNWELFCANDVQEAMDLLHEQDIDVVISDYNMPGKNGLDFLKEVKAHPDLKGLPFIILTGNAEHELKHQALEYGATDFLNKPIQREDLLARLASSLQLKRYQDELKQQNEVLDRRVRERTLQLSESRIDIIWRLAKAGEFRDEETGNHVVRVGAYCRTLAEKLNLDQQFIELVFLTAPLHDIGKIGISDTILLKPGKLTPEERTVMEEHCSIGSNIMTGNPKGIRIYTQWFGIESQQDPDAKPNPFIQMAADIAMNHHEKWDGSGYPRGLKGDEAPLEARMTAIADVFDALRSKRPYKPEFSIEKTMSIMRDGAGKHFDPDLFAVFEDAIDDFKEIHSTLKDD